MSLKLDDLVKIYLIIFLTFAGISSIAGAAMLYQGKIDSTGFLTVALAGAGIGTGVIKAFSDAIKYLKGLLCDYGVAPDCEAYKFAWDHGWRPKA